jgi:HD-like signal output (HDOD) protein
MVNTRTLVKRLGGKLILPSLPDVVERLQRALSDPHSSMKDIGLVLQGDPPLSARVLRIANSVYYGLRVRILDITHAATILGVDTLQSIVLQIATEHLFANLEPHREFDPRVLWKHSILTAKVAGSGLPDFCKGMTRAEIYSTGLLHDIGSFVMHEHLDGAYAECVEEARERGLPQWEMEIRRFGFTHAHVGELVAKRWNLPRLAIQAIARHHDPKVVDSDEIVVPWIAAANHIASHVVATDEGPALDQPLAPAMLERLGLEDSHWLDVLLSRALEFKDEEESRDQAA